MLDPRTRLHIQAIHDSDTGIVLVVAGAGTQALSDLLGVAGATRTLLEALVPYSAAAFDEFLGQPPTQYVSSDTARLLAGRAFTRARWLDQESLPVAGIACTATIITDRPKLGEHRAHLAAWNHEQLVSHSLHLEKGARDRHAEEALVSTLLLNLLAHACQLDSQLHMGLRNGDQMESVTFDFAQMVSHLLDSKIDYFGISADGQIHAPSDPAPKAILSGAFNPLHDGHLAMAEAASDILNHPVTFELSVANADKPSLDRSTILERTAQFAGRWPIYVGTAPTFLQKARLYPGATFVVGYDTASRILEPRYYQDSQELLTESLSEIEQRGCRFLVAGRIDEDGVFRDLHDLSFPPRFAGLFRPIPGQRFRKDISSTELRQSGRRGSR